jgi:hypothetical protein
MKCGLKTLLLETDFVLNVFFFLLSCIDFEVHTPEAKPEVAIIL